MSLVTSVGCHKCHIYTQMSYLQVSVVTTQLSWSQMSVVTTVVVTSSVGGHNCRWSQLSWSPLSWSQVVSVVTTVGGHNCRWSQIVGGHKCWSQMSDHPFYYKKKKILLSLPYLSKTFNFINSVKGSVTSKDYYKVFYGYHA